MQNELHFLCHPKCRLTTPEERGRRPSRSATLLPCAKPRAPKTTQWSCEAGKQPAPKVKILEGGLTSISFQDWKEAIEWLLKRKEETGKIKWDDAPWHFLPRWGLVDHKDPNWAAWRRLFQGKATHKYRYYNPHFSYLVTLFTDAMPISSIGDALSDMFFNPKYVGCVWKVTVAAANLGNIVWVCPVLPGTSADVKIWDRHGPHRTKDCFMDFEVGVRDGAYKG